MDILSRLRFSVEMRGGNRLRTEKELSTRRLRGGPSLKRAPRSPLEPMRPRYPPLGLLEVSGPDGLRKSSLRGVKAGGRLSLEKLLCSGKLLDW